MEEPSTLYFIHFYVPEENLEEVKEALFAAGAGSWGNYDRCSWEVKGTGQFRPLARSRPHIGKAGEIERVEEFRVEMACSKERVERAVRALLEAHPYETPAYGVAAGESDFTIPDPP